MSPDPNGQFASPYVAMGNNPVSGTDPTGGFCDGCLEAFLAAGGKLGPEITVTASRILDYTLADLSAYAVKGTIKEVGNNTQVYFNSKIQKYVAAKADIEGTTFSMYDDGAWSQLNDPVAEANNASRVMQDFAETSQKAVFNTMVGLEAAPALGELLIGAAARVLVGGASRAALKQSFFTGDEIYIQSIRSNEN